MQINQLINQFKINMTESQAHQAFTLSEVLITLGIIGVVASLTIPSLITSYQKIQTASQLKKANTTLSQAMKMSEIDNGPVQFWDWGIAGDAVSIGQNFDTYWSPYLKIVKKCSSYSDCGYNSLQPWFTLKNIIYTLYVVHTPSRSTAILPDGSLILIENYDSNGSSMKKIFLDLNASKGPNKLGKDVFMFDVDSKKGIMPYMFNSSTVDVNSNCSKSVNGEACAAKIMKDGWQINDDYPW